MSMLPYCDDTHCYPTPSWMAPYPENSTAAATTPAKTTVAQKRWKRSLFSFMLYPSFLHRQRHHHHYKQSRKSPSPLPSTSTSSTFFRPTSKVKAVTVRNTKGGSIEKIKQLRRHYSHEQQQQQQQNSVHKFFSDSLIIMYHLSRHLLAD